MKIPINVIDLDDTLIPYDSMRAYVIHFMKHGRSKGRIRLLTLLRVCRLMSNAAFNAAVVKAARKNNDYEATMRYFAERALESVDSRVRELIRQHSSGDSKNVLCSASVADYVQLIAANLKWECIASDFNADGTYDHNYGTNKVTSVKKRYPEKDFEYNFAIADSPTDGALLSLFRNSVIWKKNS